MVVPPIVTCGAVIPGPLGVIAIPCGIPQVIGSRGRPPGAGFCVMGVIPAGVKFVTIAGVKFVTGCIGNRYGDTVGACIGAGIGAPMSGTAGA